LSGNTTYETSSAHATPIARPVRAIVWRFRSILSPTAIGTDQAGMTEIPTAISPSSSPPSESSRGIETGPSSEPVSDEEATEVAASCVWLRGGAGGVFGGFAVTVSRFSGLAACLTRVDDVAVGAAGGGGGGVTTGGGGGEGAGGGGGGGC